MSTFKDRSWLVPYLRRVTVRVLPIPRTVPSLRAGWARTGGGSSWISTWGRLSILLVLAFAFQGSRGLWEPDEGYYANAALQMLDSGDYLVPHLNGAPFLDKPPLVYWIQVAGVLLLGRSEWGLRLGHGLLLAASALLAGASARRSSSDPTAVDASLIFATLPIAFLGANVLTPDMPLAFGLAVALYGLIQLESNPEPEGSSRAWLTTGLGFGLALLAKGPAALPFAAAALVHRIITGRLVATLRDGWAWTGAVLALTPVIVWYFAVSVRLPGAASYFLDQQVVGRILSTHLERNPGWTGALRVYGPTLLVGFAPWAAHSVLRLRSWVPRAWRDRHGASAAPRIELLLVLWIALPMAVFVLAPSRLPLYLLPLAAPVAILAHLAQTRDPLRTSRRREKLVGRFVAAALLLIGVRAWAASIDHYRDSRGAAKEIAGFLRPNVHRVVSVDVNRNGFLLYCAEGIEWVTKDPTPYPYYSPLETLDEELAEIASCPLRHALIVSRRDVDEIHAALVRVGQLCSVESSPRHNPVLICEPSEPPSGPVIAH